MNITYLGTEMKLSEYLYRYEEMMLYVLQKSSLRIYRLIAQKLC